MKKRILQIIAYVFFILLAIIIILPLVWMVITGFKTNQEMFLSPFSLPEKWHWENYTNAWSKGIGVYLSNSVIITVGATVLSTFVSCLAAYPLARIHFKGKKMWILLILGGLMLAPQSSVISLFRMVRIVGMYDTRTSLILIDAAFRIPFATFLTMTFYKSISYSLDESAYIDGATTWQIFRKIIVPLSKPIIASCAIVSFRAVWNELMFANIMLQSTEKKTVPVGLMNFQGMTTTNWTLVIASMVIASLPLVIAFLLLQKQFVRGLTAGSVKG
ncbi:carbohydrate ABC transporter permease [Mediterraneibacter massiliensis]|jgi:raffinose/stachyose/melibiose transport system permease protein|uniref:carbohydrate ABC transporter permease n=1 Tax=Mediterraneibacter massiliensis TaxID=1720300 RepID=UPI000E4AAC59|nr:carbohydrate ABC transporter permease [Mediterraneibacter massiliensis]RGT71013.1 carbohydrate ABC transporter permease [Ruminococcus sp. AF18-22]